MLEIPESKVIANQLTNTIKGKTMVHVQAGHTPHGFAFFFGEPADYPELLEGRKIDKVQADAGRIEIYAGDARISFNDGTNLRYFEKGTPKPDKHQLLIEFDDESFLTCSIQMYGGIQAFLDGQLDDNFYYTVAKEKPSPLSEEFDRAYFDQLWDSAKPAASAKAFLATEQRIPGLGNGVLQDILFHAGVNPKSKLKALGEAEKTAIYDSVKNTLADMTKNGGRDTEKDLFGNPGGYESILSKNTWQLGCPVCGGPIERKAYLGGNVYYCPVCQPQKG